MNKRLVAFLIGAQAFFLFIMFSTFVKTINKEHQKVLEMSEYAYETGCYDFAIVNCAKFLDDRKTSEACQIGALETCESSGKSFREWIAGGKK